MPGASRNVQIIDAAFFMPALNRSRRIWLYLPAGYASSRKKYPVLYMHDGQNLFDEATSYSGEWGVDEIMDSFSNACIVVGIDNGGTLRMNEYNPNDTSQFGKGEGLGYLQFIVKTLKPFIDKKYRTLRSSKNTLMAGSSMGGLITFYAGMYYPTVFGRLGIFSPSFWISPQIPEQISKTVKPGKHAKQVYYFYAGGAESPRLLIDMMQVTSSLSTYSKATIEVYTNPEGQHNEASWGEAFTRFYQWMMK